jgi:hypothetical protein
VRVDAAHAQADDMRVGVCEAVGPRGLPHHAARHVQRHCGQQRAILELLAVLFVRASTGQSERARESEREGDRETERDDA